MSVLAAKVDTHQPQHRLMDERSYASTRVWEPDRARDRTDR